MNRVLEANGAKGGQDGRMGHGLGMQLTEWPSNAVFDNTVLENGMVLTGTRDAVRRKQNHGPRRKSGHS